MNALDVLMYIYWLLRYCTSSDLRIEYHATQQHLLHMYVLYLELDRLETSPLKRRFWVRPIFKNYRRHAQGASDNLIFEMEMRDREQYLRYLRMNNKMFNKLLYKVRPYIEKQHVVREPIPAYTRLHICLRYLASGDSMESIAYVFRVSPNTVSKIVRETCEAIWIVLKPSSFPRLSTEGWLSHARTFEEKWNFHHCIGAVDGKLVLMQAPANSGSLYYTYKQRFSMNLMAVADAHYRFIAIDIGAPGRRSDGGVFRESSMGRRFERCRFQVPQPEAVNSNGPILPYVLVGDEAFPLSSYLMRPYPRSGVLNLRKKIFNYRLSRSRRVVESAFGILAARWRIYRKEIIGSVELVRNIIQATTCLHNWLITETLKNPTSAYQYTHLTPADRAQPINGLQNFPRQHEIVQHDSHLDPIEVREQFASYFESDEGAVAWQWEKVLNNNF